MSQTNQKKDTKGNPNRIRTIYLANIIFLCCLTLISLAFALFVFFRLRMRGSDGYRSLYTEGQIRSIEEKAAAQERESLLLEIQSSLESGRSATQMLREIFEDSIVVVNGDRYYFYPGIDGIDKNPLAPGTLVTDGDQVIYAGVKPAAYLSRGALVSDDNGKIDWDRLAKSGISEVMLTAGVLTEDQFFPDTQLERNCAKAAEMGIPAGLCLEIAGPAGKDTVSEAAAFVLRTASSYNLIPEANTIEEAGEETKPDKEDGTETDPEDPGVAAGQDQPAPEEKEFSDGEGRLPILVRIHQTDMFHDDEGQKAWTETVRTLCEQISGENIETVIGAGIYTFAAQIDLKKVDSFDRWLIDHEDTASFPYRFSFWEYSREGHLDGVPGDSFLYARITMPEQILIEEKK